MQTMGNTTLAEPIPQWQLCQILGDKNVAPRYTMVSMDYRCNFYIGISKFLLGYKIYFFTVCYCFELRVCPTCRMWLDTWDTAPFQTSMSLSGTDFDELSTTYSYKTDTISACRNTDDTEGREGGREGEGGGICDIHHRGIEVDPSIEMLW